MIKVSLALGFLTSALTSALISAVNPGPAWAEVTCVQTSSGTFCTDDDARPLGEHVEENWGENLEEHVGEDGHGAPYVLTWDPQPGADRYQLTIKHPQTETEMILTTEVTQTELPALVAGQDISITALDALGMELGPVTPNPHKRSE
jgi:hypothetical protein